jgi:citrate synthase
MGMMISTIAALSTFITMPSDIFDAESRRKQTYRLVGKDAHDCGIFHWHTLGMPYIYPDNELSLSRQFSEHAFPHDRNKIPSGILTPGARALVVLFILHADHEQNCSTNTIRE